MVRKDARKQETNNRSDQKSVTKPKANGSNRPRTHERMRRPGGGGTNKAGISLFRRALSVMKYAALILFLPPFLNFAALHQEAKHLKPNGEYYDIGFGQKLFMGCLGTGHPTVILDAPTGMSSDVWSVVHTELSKTTKVCIYDRAGLGFSERPPKNYSEDKETGGNSNGNKWQEFTVERMADDMHRLFTQSSQQQVPFVLVGSEIGAMVARFYAQIYETDVSDLVLVDPLVENIFSQDNNIWDHFWGSHLVPSFQSMQLAAATGISRILLLFGAMETPIAGENLSDETIKRQKYLMCNPRHLSSVVDEHHFINASFSQMQTLFKMKAFPSNISVTVITGNYYDEQLPSALNKAWAKSQQHLISRLHPTSHHIVVNGADHRMLYRKPDAVIEPLKRIIRHRRRLASDYQTRHQ